MTEHLVISADPVRWVLAGLIVLVWLAFTAFKLRPRMADGGITESCLVISASQTGHAADLAEQTRSRIEAAGDRCALIEADQLTPDILRQARSIFFVASTTGEGTAPDNASRFERTIMTQSLDLSAARVAVLALGDRRYAEYCAFGRRIAAWTRDCGAKEMFPKIEVDDLSPTDLAEWDRQLESLGYAEIASDAGVQVEWRIAERKMVAAPTYDNAGEQTSGGLFRVALRPLEGEPQTWETGDLFELRTADGHLRDYSIASLPREEGLGGEDIVLFVRRIVDRGVPGRGSGLLTESMTQVVSGRVRAHASFRPAEGDGPLLAIGAGSGWAGLRPHLLNALAGGHRCRLFFGERAVEEHGELIAEMRRMEDSGGLEQLVLALSGQILPGGNYVQNRLEDHATTIPEYLGEKGRIVICGRMVMGEQSLAVLGQMLGEHWISRATAEGRLRRDLY
jgi:sulfite reductase (NADPH) flavoprotein alpha-component